MPNATLGPLGFVLGLLGFALGPQGFLGTNMLVSATQNTRVGVKTNTRPHISLFVFWWNIGLSDLFRSYNKQKLLNMR